MARTIPRGAYEVLGLPEIAAGERFALEYVCRAQVQPAYLGDHRALCRMLGRFKFLVDTRDLGFGANVLLDGFWEMWLTMIMARAIRPGMTVVDVGANFGYYSLLMSDLVGPTGRLVAVEPNPAARALLRQSLALNALHHRTLVVEAAAGATSEGTALLYVPASEPKNALILDDPALADLEAGTLIEVPLWSLDAAREAIGRVDFVKIDAEGAEQAILSGMSRTLAQDKPSLVLEYNVLRYDDPGALLDHLISIYGVFHAIMFDGTLLPASKSMVMEDNGGEDWLLYFSTDWSSAMPLPENKRRRGLRVTY